MPRTLIARATPALLALGGAAGVFAVLALLVHDHTGNRLDSAVYRRVQELVPARGIAAALHLTDPPLIVALFLAVVGWAALRRHWRAIALAIVVPAASVLLAEHVFKPWVHRTYGGAYAFPSGHESGVASFACVAGLLLLGSRARLVARTAGLLVLAAQVFLAAVGLVGSDYHYATDTLGSLALCLCVTIVAAFAIDAIAGARSHARATDRRDEVAPRVARSVDAAR